MLLSLQCDEDWQSRWNAIDKFIEIWLSPDFQRNYDHSRIDVFEAELGCDLPTSAKHWCSLALTASTTNAGFTVRDELRVSMLPEHNAISLLLQGEGDTYWDRTCLL
jgi:hypothetical protein